LKAKVFSKRLRAIVTTGYYLKNNLTKLIYDHGRVSQIFSFLFGKSLSDSSSVSDSITKSVIKCPSDAPSASDSLVFDVEKEISDFALVTGVIDVVNLTTNKTLVEVGTVSDSGLILNQSYVETGYLAEDYVGVSRTF
jgi:hypothetical protein